MFSQIYGVGLDHSYVVVIEIDDLLGVGDIAETSLATMASFSQTPITIGLPLRATIIVSGKSGDITLSQKSVKLFQRRSDRPL